MASQGPAIIVAMRSLAPCPDCHRHVQESDPCPFCAGPSKGSAAVALLAAAVVGCSGGPTRGDVPAYGGPPGDFDRRPEPTPTATAPAPSPTEAPPAPAPDEPRSDDPSADDPGPEDPGAMRTLYGAPPEPETVRPDE